MKKSQKRWLEIENRQPTKTRSKKNEKRLQNRTKPTVSNGPYIELYGAVFNDFCTDQKISVSSFQINAKALSRPHTAASH